nr:uncharacterized protein LOC113820212 isoform X2 [Penaeus vannamei]
MRLYTPAKPSTSLGEDVAPRTDAPPREDRTFNFDSRSADLADRSIENEPRLDERLQINAPRIDDKPQLNLARLDDKLHLNGPLREEQLPGSPTRSRFIGVEVVPGTPERTPDAEPRQCPPREWFRHPEVARQRAMEPRRDSDHHRKRVQSGREEWICPRRRKRPGIAHQSGGGTEATSGREQEAQSCPERGSRSEQPVATVPR